MKNIYFFTVNLNCSGETEKIITAIINKLAEKKYTALIPIQTKMLAEPNLYIMVLVLYISKKVVQEKIIGKMNQALYYINRKLVGYLVLCILIAVDLFDLKNKHIFVKYFNAGRGMNLLGNKERTQWNEILKKINFKNKKLKKIHLNLIADLYGDPHYDYK